MGRQPGFFDTDERLRWLSEAGDPLERLAAVVDFELFRPELEAAPKRSDRAKGGRPNLGREFSLAEHAVAVVVPGAEIGIDGLLTEPGVDSLVPLGLREFAIVIVEEAEKAQMRPLSRAAVPA